MAYEPSKNLTYLPSAVEPIVQKKPGALAIKVKPIHVKLRSGQDMGDLIQISRSLGKRVFRTDDNIRVIDLLRINRFEWIAMCEYVGVQGSEVVPRGF